MRISFLLLLGVIGLPAFAAVSPPQNGIIASYTFEGNANDQSGHGNNATPDGIYSYIAGGHSGSAIRLNGDGALLYANGGYVRLPLFDSSLNSAFTLSLWAKDESIIGGEEYLSLGIVDQPQIGIGINNQAGTKPTLYWYMNSGAGNPNATQITKTFDSLSALSGSWKNLIITYGSGVFSAYYNGVLVSQANVSFSGFPLPVANLGRHYWSTGSSARMSVTMDDVVIYDRALSAAEVRAVAGVDETAPTPTSHLINMSSRAVVGGGGSFIAGFVIQGNAQKQILIRAVGPGLTTFGISSPLSAPVIDVYSGGTVIGHNEGWAGAATLANAFTAVGAFPLQSTSKDAAIIMTVDPGAYTAIVSGKSGASGEALLEVYEMP